MTPTRRDEGIDPQRRPIFLDESGRRRRWVNRVGASMAVTCVAYAVVVAGEMAQTGVGPLAYVPAAGNGIIAGLPATSGVPGLLAEGPASPERTAVGNSRTAVPTVRPAAAAGLSEAPHIQPARTRSQNSMSRSNRSASASTGSTASSTHARKKLT